MKGWYFLVAIYMLHVKAIVSGNTLQNQHS